MLQAFFWLCFAVYLNSDPDIPSFNTSNDVIDFLKRGSIKHKVAAIVDGDYWDKYRDIIKAEFINNPNVLITSITEITERIDP